MMEEDRLRRERYYRQKVGVGKIWRPYNDYCWICTERTHTTRQCKFTFDRVKVKMEMAEREKQNIRNQEAKEKTYAMESGHRYKRQKGCFTALEELMESYKDAFYNKGEKIRFCSLEKCKITTKAKEKVVKRGAIVPQALRKKLDEHLLDLEERGIIRRSASDWRNPI